MATERKTQDYSFAGGLGNINPAEMPEEAVQKYKDTLDEQVKALQKRYEEPNWFKVAAGFAKPQLGGFLASLGSAAEAMGENVEQEREQQLPIAQMKVQMEQANMLLAQKQKQNQIYQEWRKSGKPMDADTYSRITSLGKDTDIAKAAAEFYTGAEKGLGITTAATKAMGADPMLQLDDYAKFQLHPDTDPSKAQARQDQFVAAVNAAKPPQVDQAQWESMSRYDKMEAAANYAREQREKGMGVEEVMRQQANQAPERLALLRSIRDLSLGVGLADSKTPDGKVVTGQQQIGELLNKFGGNNPMEVFARAAADGKLGDTLAGIDNYARQIGMSEEAKNKFQVLVKLLAENQVALRGSSLNPTDAFSQLQQTASPNIGNSQAALVTLVDLMGHAEKNAQNRYQFIKENKIPYGHLETNRDYNRMRSEYADEHSKIATQNPLMSAPSWYNPAEGSRNTQTKPRATSQSGGASGASVTLSDIEREIERRKKKTP
ncbi:hypothetical protein [Caudoviricetes sp.]|nr:hypothetical protein [Caudoviricetes sp.]